MAPRRPYLLPFPSLSNPASFVSTITSKTSRRRTAPKLTRQAFAVSLLVLVVLGTALPSWAATYTVTSTADGGTGSLRATLAMAANGDTIDFRLKYPATITLTSGYLEIATNVNIKGPGATKLFISGNNASTVLQVDSTVTGLGATISGVTIEDGFNLTYGGGIYNEGTLKVSSSTVSGNYASTPSGNAYGGGIYNKGTLKVSSSTVSGNYASTPTNNAYGGGIYNASMLTLSSSTVSGNYAGGYWDAAGGGIYNPGTLTVSNSTVSSNRAEAGNFQSGEGGGIFNGGSLTVSNSTFSGNSTPENGYGIGGGIINSGTLTVRNTTFSAEEGGGIFGGDKLTVINSTFSGNSAQLGGGIFNLGNLTVSNSTFSGNSAYGDGGGGIYNYGTLTLKATLMANEPAGGNCYLPGGTTTSDGYNVSDDSTCSFLTATGDQSDVTTAVSYLGPLQNNGGPTQTIALLPGSTAVDAIPVAPINKCTDASGNPVKTDQRGVPRPQGPGCDIGAYELVQAVRASPMSVSFGNVELCQTKKEVVTLYNDGSTQAQIGPVSFIDTSGNSGDFSDIEYCHNGNLVPGKNCTVAVKFSPSEAAAESAVLNIVTNAPGSPLQVPITATGTANKNCRE